MRCGTPPTPAGRRCHRPTRRTQHHSSQCADGQGRAQPGQAPARAAAGGAHGRAARSTTSLPTMWVGSAGGAWAARHVLARAPAFERGEPDRPRATGGGARAGIESPQRMSCQVQHRHIPPHRRRFRSSSNRAPADRRRSAAVYQRARDVTWRSEPRLNCSQLASVGVRTSGRVARQRTRSPSDRSSHNDCGALKSRPDAS